MNWPAFWRGFRRGFALQGFGEILCGLTHGGGQIKRDGEGRINWQCAKCGRWSRYPVPLGEEQSAIALKSAAPVNHRPARNKLVPRAADLRVNCGPSPPMRSRE